jgi:hypothetical protein
MKASVSRAWNETKRTVAVNFSTLLTIGLAFLVLPATILGAVEPSTMMGMAPASPVPVLLTLVVTLIGLAGRLTVAKLVLGPPATLGDTMRHAVRRTPAPAGAFLLFMVPVALLLGPFLLQIVKDPANPPPAASMAVSVIGLVALALGIRLLGMAVPIAASESGGPVRVMRRSWQVTSGNWWRLGAVILLFFIAASIAGWAAARVVGSLVAIAAGEIEALSVPALALAAVLAIIAAMFAVLLAAMLAHLYAQLTGPDEALASVPSTGA